MSNSQKKYQKTWNDIKEEEKKRKLHSILGSILLVVVFMSFYILYIFT